MNLGIYTSRTPRRSGGQLCCDFDGVDGGASQLRQRSRLALVSGRTQKGFGSLQHS
jgi:hypothetical protein